MSKIESRTKIIGHARFKEGKLVLPAKTETLGQKRYGKPIYSSNKNEVQKEATDTLLLILQYIGYAVLILAFIALKVLSSSKVKTPKPLNRRGLSSNHYVKTRQRRAMYARKGGSR